MRQTCIHFVPEGLPCALCKAAWIIRNAEPAPDIYVDPQRRGEWREAREKWLTEHEDFGSVESQP